MVPLLAFKPSALSVSLAFGRLPALLCSTSQTFVPADVEGRRSEKSGSEARE